MRITLELTRSARADESHADDLERETYLVRVVTDDEAGFRDAQVETAVLDWAKLMPQLDALHADSRDPRARKRIGKRLRKFLRGTEWTVHEARIQEARARPGEPIHVTIRSDAAELFLVPWELLDLKSIGLALGALDQVVIGHAWPGTATVTANDRPGRALVAWSAAGGSVPMASHIAAIGDALASTSGLDMFDAERDVVASVTPRALDEALSAAGRPPVTILHLLCHGSADRRGYRLTWNGPAGTVDVSPDDLATWLAPYARSIRLVTLCACESGDGIKGDRELGSMAQAIHRVGVPWVIGSRYPLSTAGSVHFTQTFYHRLATRSTVEQAFVHARKQLSFDTERRDHISLQLYARSQDRGQPLFRPASTTSGPHAIPVRRPTTRGDSGPHTGGPRMNDLALKLDRTHQWAHLRTLCETSDRSRFVCVYGEKSQYVNLFCERVQRYFNTESPRLHLLYRLRFTDQDSTPTVVEDWEERLVDALPFGVIPVADVLRLATERHPILLILGDRPLCDLDEEQSQALAEFVGERLPALIADLPDAGHQPVRVLIPIEQSASTPGARSPLIVALGDAAGRAHARAIDTDFVSLGFPVWEDIEAFLRRAVTDRERASAHYRTFVAECWRMFHDIAGRPEDERDFSELTTGMHRLLEVMHSAIEADDRAEGP